jgi:hypothetical protein
MLCIEKRAVVEGLSVGLLLSSSRMKCRIGVCDYAKRAGKGSKAKSVEERTIRRGEESIFCLSIMRERGRGEERKRKD